MQIFFNIILIQSRFSLVSESESFCISKCALPVSRVSISNSSKSFQLHDRQKRIFLWISRIDQDKGLTWNDPRWPYRCHFTSSGNQQHLHRAISKLHLPKWLDVLQLRVGKRLDHIDWSRNWWSSMEFSYFHLLRRLRWKFWDRWYNLTRFI